MDSGKSYALKIRGFVEIKFLLQFWAFYSKVIVVKLIYVGLFGADKTPYFFFFLYVGTREVKGQYSTNLLYIIIVFTNTLFGGNVNVAFLKVTLIKLQSYWCE